MLYTPRELNQIVDECFSGEGEQSCDSCPANRDSGGPCCFGVPEEHDPRDRQCQDCPYFYECREYVRTLRNASSGYKPTTVYNHTFGSKEYHARRPVQIATERKPTQIAVNRPSYVSQRAFSISPTDDAIDRAIAVRERDGSLGSRFVKDAVWFGARGIFEYGFWFFDTYRLP